MRWNTKPEATEWQLIRPCMATALTDPRRPANRFQTSNSETVEEVPAGQWANGGKVLPLGELLKEMGGDVSEERGTGDESTFQSSKCTEGALWHSGVTSRK
jgi:hypothetical protein